MMTAMETCQSGVVAAILHQTVLVNFAEAGFELQTNWIDLLIRQGGVFGGNCTISSMTSISDPWSETDQSRTATLQLRHHPPLLIRDLGWSRQEAAEVRLRLALFEDDWNAPGMDAYDAL
jgi:hypothetical protein